MGPRGVFVKGVQEGEGRAATLDSPVAVAVVAVDDAGAAFSGARGLLCAVAQLLASFRYPVIVQYTA